MSTEPGAESSELEALDIVKGLRKLVDGAVYHDNETLPKEMFGQMRGPMLAGLSTWDDKYMFVIAPAGRELLTLLDAARPQRAPVEGRCFCEGEQCAYCQRIACEAPSFFYPGYWTQVTPYADTELQNSCKYAYCPHCGAALRAGYAERGGDTRIIEQIAALVMNEPSGQPGQHCCDISYDAGVARWRVHYKGHDARANGSDIRVALNAAATYAESKHARRVQADRDLLAATLDHDDRELDRKLAIHDLTQSDDAASPADPGGDVQGNELPPVQCLECGSKNSTYTDAMRCCAEPGGDERGGEELSPNAAAYAADEAGSGLRCDTCKWQNIDGHNASDCSFGYATNEECSRYGSYVARDERETEGEEG